MDVEAAEVYVDVSSSAEESEKYIYTYSGESIRHNAYGDYFRQTYTYEFCSDVRLAFWQETKLSKNGSETLLHPFQYDSNSVTSANGSVYADTVTSVVIENTGVSGVDPVGEVVIKKNNLIYDLYAATSISRWSHGLLDEYKASWDIPTFRTLEDAIYYLKTGDDSKRIEGTSDSLDKEHDFSSDVYNPDIPVPIVSKINHTGFILDNNDGYYVDLIIRNGLYGVKFESQKLGLGLSPTWMTVPDKDWPYTKHLFNFVDGFGKNITGSNIVIRDAYGVDVQQKLIEDFKDWTNAYPKDSTLPSYSWTKMGHNAEYLDFHTFKTDSSLTDAQQLRKSGQAWTSYYIRYRDSEGSYGQFACYTINDAHGTINNGLVSDGSVSSGIVDVDENGNVIIKDEQKGSVDYDNDDTINYRPPDSYLPDNFKDYNSSLEAFTDTMNNFGSFLTTIPAFAGKVFSFLPWWANALLAFGIGICVLLRILGR